jgi:hypothetical protein
MRMNLTGLTDWQVSSLRSVPSVIPPSLQIYALRVAGMEEGSAVYLCSISYSRRLCITNLASMAGMSYPAGVATGTGPACNGTPA